MRWPLLFLPLVLAACAEAPDSIQAAYTSPIHYNGLSCNQLNAEKARLSNALASASAKQDQTRTADAVGIVLLMVPVGTVSGGNIAPQIASDKGQLEAVQVATRRCRS